MYPKAMILIATVGVSLSLLLGLFLVIELEVVALLVAVFIGITTLISQLNVKPKEDKREPKQVIETEEKEVFKDETIRASPDACMHIALMRTVIKGKPQAGLPYLCSGAILGYLVSSYILFGELIGLTSPF